MNSTPKTIQIFLPGGDPRGIRVAEITTRIVQVIEVPRSLLRDFLAMPASGQVALYFLFGKTDDESDEKVYIGQTGDLRARLAMHNEKKAFWERALVLVSQTNNLTNTHTLFLEWHCLQEAKKAERYVFDNGNGGSKPHTPPPLEADCIEVYETGRTLLATLGYPLFEPVAKGPAAVQEAGEYYCKAKAAQGRGLYTSEGFVVLKGSIAESEIVPSSKGTWIEVHRQRLLESGVMRAEGSGLVFERDHLFSSPSAAASVVIGRSANGWDWWKTKDGRTLDQVIRKTPQTGAE